MANLKAYHEIGAELEKRLRSKTFPLAIKLLKREKDIPKGAKRPLRDFNHHLSLCQTYQISRRDGTTIAMLKEDMWCFEPVVGYGLAEPPKDFLDGQNRFPRDVETLEAGQHYAAEFPRLEAGKYIGVVSAPLATANYEPDIVMIYCDSAQLNLLLLGREFKEGYNLKCGLSGHAACVYAAVPAIKTGDYQVAVPCRGDRYHAMAGDEEMIFTVPKSRLQDLMRGLRHVEKNGSKLPRAYTYRPEYQLVRIYEKIGKML